MNWSEICFGSRLHMQVAQSPAKDGYPRGYVFLDLENLAFLTGGLPFLSSTCRRQDIEFRAYTTPTHTQASYATHLSTSSEKEATDIRMVWDASECLVMNRDCPEGLLIITDDIFGRTLMHEEHDRVAHVQYDETLSYQWSRKFGGATSVEDFFTKIGIFRERRSRSVASSGNSRASSCTRASWSRNTSRMPSRSQSRSSSVTPGRGRRNRIDDTKTQDLLDTATAKLQQSGILKIKAAPLFPGGEEVKDGGTDELLAALRKRLHESEKTILKLRDRVGEIKKDTREKKSRKPRKWPRGVTPSFSKQVGTITRWLSHGYGFISPHSGGQPIFVHISNVHISRAAECQRRQLYELTRWDVEFEIRDSPKGPQAFNVSGPNGRQLPADTTIKPAAVSKTFSGGGRERVWGGKGVGRVGHEEMRRERQERFG